MKKQITNKQLKYIQDMGYRGGRNLADLIEFLGDDLDEISNEPNKWFITVWFKNSTYKFRATYKPELCDVLWEVVKEKLND